MIDLKSKIYVAGHNGLVGSAIVRKLKKKDIKIYCMLIKISWISQINLESTITIKKTNLILYLFVLLKLGE